MNENQPVSFSSIYRVKSRFYEEVNVGGFSHVDIRIAFFSQIAAILKPTDRVLDFGAGRGEPISDEKVPYRRWIANLQGRCAHVEGVDVDPVVLENPFLDHASTMKIGDPLPFEDESFDLIISRSVLEHVDTPEQTASELMRVLKPNGWFCAITPNAWGYITFFARLVPNKLHSAFLRYVQPGRKEEDVFPTRYKMNTRRKLAKLFGKKGRLHMFRTSAEPAYYFNSRLLFRVFQLAHKILPSTNQTHLCIFVQKK